MHYERAALLSGVKRDVGQESEERIGKLTVVDGPPNIA